MMFQQQVKTQKSSLGWHHLLVFSFYHPRAPTRMEIATTWMIATNIKYLILYNNINVCTYWLAKVDDVLVGEDGEKEILVCTFNTWNVQAFCPPP